MVPVLCAVLAFVAINAAGHSPLEFTLSALRGFVLLPPNPAIMIAIGAAFGALLLRYGLRLEVLGRVLWEIVDAVKKYLFGA